VQPSWGQGSCWVAAWLANRIEGTAAGSRPMDYSWTVGVTLWGVGLCSGARAPSVRLGFRCHAWVRPAWAADQVVVRWRMWRFGCILMRMGSCMMIMTCSRHARRGVGLPQTCTIFYTVWIVVGHVGMCTLWSPTFGMIQNNMSSSRDTDIPC